MPKYLLLKRYRGGPEPHRPVPPMEQWAPEDVEASPFPNAGRPRTAGSPEVAATSGSVTCASPVA